MIKQQFVTPVFSHVKLATSNNKCDSPSVSPSISMYVGV